MLEKGIKVGRGQGELGLEFAALRNLQWRGAVSA
jgi:hypothetical protein